MPDITSFPIPTQDFDVAAFADCQFSVPTAAALVGLVASAGNRALVLDTMRQWRFDSVTWWDEGKSPVGLLKDAVSLAQAASAVIVGSWDASSGAFPLTRPDGSGIRVGDTWAVAVSGTTGGEFFEAGDYLQALKAGGSPVFAGSWARSATGQIKKWRDEAEAAQAAAEAAQVAAEAARDNAEEARDAAFAGANVYPDTAAGLAAVGEGDQFMVVVDDEIIRYEDVGGVATEVARYPNGATVREALEFGTKRQRYLDGLRTANALRPKAAVVVLLGQSLNAPRNAIIRAKGAPVAKMPFGGGSIANWQYHALNATHTGHWSELASAVDFEERGGQTPMVGIVNTITGGKFARTYIGSVAIGARDLQTLMTGGPVTNLWAMLHRLCALARADGFDPEVFFYTAHGEANASTATTEQAYYDLGIEYYGRAQLYAAQAMRKPGYIAPIVFTSPAPGTVNTLTYAEIREAIRRLARDLPGGIDLGGIYHWPVEPDRVHPTQEGYIQRGEAVGRALRAYAEDGKRWGALHITDVTLSGTQFVATFSGPVERDASMGVGEALNAAMAEDGFEWFDNGTQIGITALAYEGWKVRGTLASAPVGTVSQQVLRIASQTISGALQVWPANTPGSLVRAQGDGWPSIQTHTYVNRVWAAPQTFSAVRTV